MDERNKCVCRALYVSHLQQLKTRKTNLFITDLTDNHTVTQHPVQWACTLNSQHLLLPLPTYPCFNTQILVTKYDTIFVHFSF